MLREAQSLVAQIRGDIPLTSAMQVQATEYDGQRLVLRVPLYANINDKATAFAGSIAALANLTGWTLLTLWVEERFGPCQVAVYHSDIRYRKPIKADFSAEVSLPAAEVLSVFEQTLEAKGKAKISLEVRLAGDDGVAAEMQGAYAVWLVNDED